MNIHGEGVRVEGMGGQQLKSEGCLCWKGATAMDGNLGAAKSKEVSPGHSNRGVDLLMTRHRIHVRILTSRTVGE